MLGIPFAMRFDGHVRVDIFYQHLTVRRRAAIDLVGTVLFLLPWLVLVGWYSLPIVLNSLFEMEKFAKTYIPGHFIIKLQLFFFIALVGLQAIANIICAVLVLTRSPGDRHLPAQAQFINGIWRRAARRNRRSKAAIHHSPAPAAPARARPARPPAAASRRGWAAP